MWAQGLAPTSQPQCYSNQVMICECYLRQLTDSFHGSSQSFSTHIIICPQALLATIYQATIPEYSKVMTNCRLFKRKAFHDLKDTHLPFVTAKQAKNT